MWKMSICRFNGKQLIAFVYDELEGTERAAFEAHLRGCEACRQELAELRGLMQVVPRQPLIVPSDAELHALRRRVSETLRRPKSTIVPGRHRGLFSFIVARPIFQFGFALLLLAFGFLLGRSSLGPPASEFGSSSEALQTLLAASAKIQAANSRIHPYLAGVDRLKYDPATGQVEIHYNTVNDIALSGDLRNPLVRDLLQLALRDSDNPAVRLHALKAIGGMAPQQPIVEPDFIETLARVLRTESNTGIRLQVLRVLRALPMQAEIKNLFVWVVLYDREMALRIEAMEALTKGDSLLVDFGILQEAAKKDTTGYMVYRLTKLRERQRPDGAQPNRLPREISRED